MSEFRAHVIATTGSAPENIEPGRLHRFSTNGRRSDTSGWCRQFPDGRAGVCGDFRTGVRSTWRADRRAPMLPSERARIAAELAAAKAQREAEQLEQWQRQAPRIAALRAKAVPVSSDDTVSHYLRARSLHLDHFPTVLRFVSRLVYRHDDESTTTHPAMLADVQSADGTLIALHRTYLQANGSKADVPTPKKLTPTCGPMAGAAIRLCDPQPDGVLGVAEGIETALAAYLGSCVPTWAAVSAHGLASFVWPAGTRRLIVFADHDGAGLRAAEHLAQRARNASVAASVLLPTEAGTDWADVLTEGAAA